MTREEELRGLIQAIECIAYNCTAARKTCDAAVLVARHHIRFLCDLIDAVDDGPEAPVDTTRGD